MRCGLPLARYEYIKELDKQRGRGQQGAKSPLLWEAGQVEELLQGSPVGKEVGLRLKVLKTLLPTNWQHAFSEADPNRTVARLCLAYASNSSRHLGECTCRLSCYTLLTAAERVARHQFGISCWMIAAYLVFSVQGIRREYEELDTVWFMGGSLFKNYPYDIPTEAFSFEIFKQAFAAIQVCCTLLVLMRSCSRLTHRADRHVTIEDRRKICLTVFANVSRTST